MFKCRDKGVEDFLKERALDFENRNLARTHLLLDYKSLSKNNIKILAYFTLSIKALHFLPNVSKRKIKEIDGFSKEAQSVGAILIGQLGKNNDFAHMISGNEIITNTLHSIYDVFYTAACKVVYLECQPISGITRFYNAHGFESLQSNPNGLSQMVRFL
jgi:predicted GNAT family N-acyltransferase